MKKFKIKNREWKSQLVQNFEKNYPNQKDFNERLNYIINTFLEYRSEHSFGEYGYDIIIDEKTEKERFELSEFLIQKFSEIKNEINVLH